MEVGRAIVRIEMNMVSEAISLPTPRAGGAGGWGQGKKVRGGRGKRG